MQESLDAQEILTTVVLGVCALGGVVCGWLFVGTWQAVIGGGLICGTAGILLVAVVGLVGHGLGRLLKPRDKR